MFKWEPPACHMMPVLVRPHLGLLQVALLFRLPGLWSLVTWWPSVCSQSQASPRTAGPRWCRGTNPPSLLSPPLPCDQYPRPRDTSFSGLTLEEYKLILSTGTGTAALWFVRR